MPRFKSKLKALQSHKADGSLNIRGMSNASDEELIALIDDGVITEDMIAELPQNHIVRNRLTQLQKQLKKDLAGQVGLREFRGNIMGALRWSEIFTWGVSKINAMKQATANSDRAKDAQIIMQARTAGEQILKLVQGGQAPQVGAPAKAAQQGIGIGGAAGGAKPDLASLIAAAKKQLAEKAAKAADGKAADGKAAPPLAGVPVNPQSKVDALKAQQAKEAEQEKQKAGGG